MILLTKQLRLDLKDVLTYRLRPVSCPFATYDGLMAKTTKAVILELIEGNCSFPKSNAIPPHAAIINMMSFIHRGGARLRRNYFTCDSACGVIIFERLRGKYFINFERKRTSAI